MRRASAAVQGARKWDAMLGQSSPLDLRWRMFGISVRIKFTFWIAWLLLGLYVLNLDWARLLMWMGVLLVSDFIHEMAHAVTGRIFGARTGVILGAFGGTPTGFEGLTRWQRMLFFAAGPAASFALWGGIEIYRVQGNPFAWGGNAAVWILRVMVLARYLNLFRACFNILPIYPLDCGMVMREICLAISRRHGLVFSLLLSFFCASAVAAYFAIAYWEQLKAIGRMPESGILPALFVVFDVMLALRSLVLLIQALRSPAPPAEEEPTRLDEPQTHADEIDNYRPFDGGRYESEKR